jgi:lactoylglutathione lyase
MNMSWVTIHISDLERSLYFYTEILGLEVVNRFTPNEEMEIAFLGKEGTQVELIAHREQVNNRFNEHFSIGFMLESSLEQFLSKHPELEYEGPIQPNPGIRFIYIKDPAGVKIQLVERL